jgi:DNA recombination protein RmuC
VTVTGPTTFSAFAMALLMGFSTLAIQRRSADIAKLLGAVKTDFGKFGELLVKVESKLDDAKDSIEKARGRSDQIVRKLAKVDELPAEEARLLLPETDADAVNGAALE